MRKKYLSALLFGALLFASAGTFTSCKDYDDDISNLQTQITANADAIKALQDKINAGTWITELTSVEGGFKVTFSDGQSFEIVNGKDGANGANGADGTKITISEDGYWCFDGNKSEYKAVVDDSQNKYVVPTIGEDGYWYLVSEETGELVKSEYKANGAAYAVEANGGYNIYMPGEDGKMLDPIYVPGPAGSITSMNAELSDADANGSLSVNVYTFNPSDADKKTWKDLTGKDVTSNKYILSSEEKIGLRINPVNVDASGINFSLYNSKNEKLPGVTFKAEEYKDYVTDQSRAAYGNGLYSLSMNPFEVKDDDAKTDLTDLFKKESANILYAVSADINTRAEYNIKVAVSDKVADIKDIQINKEGLVSDDATNDTEDKKNATPVDTKAVNAVSVTNPADLYGMWLTVSEEDADLFGIEFDQDKHTFTITADPDIITKAYFVLYIHTMDNSGYYQKQPVNIYVSNKISAEASYSKRTLNIVENSADNDANFFTADMATMTNGLGDNLSVWKKKVTGFSVNYYSDADCKTLVQDAAGITLTFIGTDGKDSDLKSAADMKFAVTNATASTKFSVDKTYYAKVTFKAGSEELNSVVIPFEFKIPAFASFFTQESAVFTNNVAYAYMSTEDTNNGEAAYKLSRAFQKYFEGAKLALDAETKIVGNYDSDDLATIATAFDGTAKITLKDVDKNKTTGTPAGYAQELIVKASTTDYLGWAYPEGEGTYTFKVKVMSPLYEGTVTPVNGVVTIPATSVDGYKLGNSDIIGTTYNKISYKVLPDAVNATDATKPAWTRPEVKEVSATASNTNVLQTIGTVTPAVKDSKGAVTEGYFTIKPQNINTTTDTEITVSVTDIWGYTKVNPVKVQVTVDK